MAISHVRYAFNYLLIAGLLVVSWLVSLGTPVLFTETFPHLAGQGAILVVFFEAVMVLIFGFLAYELAKPTVIPSFVLAIFIGMLERAPLSILVDDSRVLTVLATLGAALILFGGGLETPFTRFKKLIGPILSLAFIATIVTALLFSWVLGALSPSFGLALPVGAIILLGSALASTDPAAIIPSLKSLAFKNPRARDLAVSESAINDVIGAVLTTVFLGIVLGTGHAPEGPSDEMSLFSTYSALLSAHTGMEILRELVIGSVVGTTGFGILHFWSKWKARTGLSGDADSALFLAVPLACYVLAVTLGGSGFLAVFIAGLLFNLEEHIQHVEHYFNHTIEGFMKPLIFMLLGAAVDPASLLSVAGLGISLGLLFMFVIRPIAVFLSLALFMRGKKGLTFRELLFLSFVRETGVIPAVLLIGFRVSGLPEANTVVALGLWVILLTLIIQPPFTPFVAKLLGIAADMPAFPVGARQKGPTAVLCSRGWSFLDRMQAVTDWAVSHGVKSVTLLHCPESRYSERFRADVETQATALFGSINSSLESEGRKPLDFSFVIRPGLLQDNIESFLSGHEASIVFVGSKMLDYRLEDVKRLRVPFVFIP